MLELLAYVVLLAVVMPALLFGAGKFIAAASTRPSSSGGVVSRAESLAPPDYGTLRQRLNAAAKANPLLPRVSVRPKGR